MVARNQVGIDPREPLDYIGAQFSFLPCFQAPRRPTVTDIRPQFSLWRVGTNSPSQTLINGVAGEFWYLSYFNSTGQAIWLMLSSGTVGPLLEFTGSGATVTGFPVSPNGSGQINLTSALGTIAITGTASNINFDLTGGSLAIDQIAVDASTPPGTNPVLATAAGQVTIRGGASYATGTTTTATRTNSLAANTLDIQSQLAGSNAASSSATRFGVSQFDANHFDVTSGFVQLKGGGVNPAATSFPTDSGTAVPSATGALSILGQATPNVTGVRFTGAGNTVSGTMFSPFAGNFTFTTTGSTIVAGSPIVLAAQNLDNTNTGSDAIVQIGSGGASGGDAFVQTGVQGAGVWCTGVKNNDGDSYQIAFGNTLTSGVLVKRIDSGTKARTMILQPAFMAYANATLTDVTGDGTDYTIAFNTESYDQGSNFASNTFTVSQAGIHSFNASVFMQQIDAGHTSGAIWFQASSGQITYIWDGDPSAVATSGNLIVNGTARMSLAAAATVTLHVLIGGGTKTVDIQGSALSGGPTQFSGELLF